MAALLFATAAWANPTTPEQARSVVLNWLGLEAAPLHAPLGGQVSEVQTFADGSGNPAYYVVYLNPTGMVFVPADDLVEPIICFLPEGRYDPSPANPLGALVSRDIPGRVLQARQVEAQSPGDEGPPTPESPQATAQRKWAWLEGAVPAPKTPGLESGSGIAIVSDLRVAPLIQTRWSQTTVDDTTTGLACYNYFTPPYPASTQQLSFWLRGHRHGAIDALLAVSQDGGGNWYLRDHGGWEYGLRLLAGRQRQRRPL